MNYPNHMKVWLNIDKQKLVDLFIDGHDWKEISEELGRTEFAVKSKLYQIHNSPQGVTEEALSEELNEHINQYESTGKYAGMLQSSKVEKKKEERQPAYHKELKALLGREFFFKGIGSKYLFTVSTAVATQHDKIYIGTKNSSSYYPLEDCEFIVEIVHLD